MKIKNPSKRHLRRSVLRKANVQYWLVPEKPRKVGRLKQLNKYSKSRKSKSEFVTMVTKIEEGS